jgi:hypothetical protein
MVDDWNAIVRTVFAQGGLGLSCKTRVARVQGLLDALLVSDYLTIGR